MNSHPNGFDHKQEILNRTATNLKGWALNFITTESNLFRVHKKRTETRKEEQIEGKKA